MEKRRLELNAEEFPCELQRFLQNTKVYDSSESSNATVYFCDSGYYIKIDARGELAREAELSRYFYENGLGAEVIAYTSSNDKDFLVTRSVTGKSAHHCLNEPKKLCEVVATALHDLHRRPITGVPVSSRYQRYLDSVNGDFNGGFYDRSVLMERFMIGSKKDAWDIMQTGKGALRSDTLIHGDASLKNMILHKGRFSAFIDFSMAGVGDRHIDLYWAVWSLMYFLKTDRYADCFFDAYGRGNFQMDILKVVAAFELFG